MTFEVGPEDAGQRLDQFLVRQLPETSRARLQELIRAGHVLVAGVKAKPSARLRAGEGIALDADVAAPALARAFPEEIPLEILYEDDDLVAVNKPAGMAVHAGAGIAQGTLVNVLLYHFRELSKVGGELRPGVVHRLDRFTSGVLLVAKSDRAHVRLARQFARHEVKKTYLALVHGRVRETRGRTVVIGDVPWTRLELPIRRDRRHRVKMTTRAKEGRPAVTEFRILKEFPGFSLLEVRIGTGRTHQIRVHLSSIGHPVVGDTLYGGRTQPALARYFLHAREIVFTHPSSGEPVRIQAPLPPELENHLADLRAGHPRLALL